MDSALKVRLLNKLFAASAPCGFALCVDAARGIESALAEKSEIDIAIFAKRILKLYNPEAAVEVVELNPHEPLFALAPLSRAARKLSGYQKAYLVICGLSAVKTKTKKKMAEHFGDIDTIEGYISRYEKSVENLEIIFL